MRKKVSSVKTRINKTSKSNFRFFDFNILYVNKSAKRVLAFVLVVAFLFLNKAVTKADVAYFYSPLCLGSWDHPEQIEGAPQVPLGSDLTAYNQENSAILSGSSGEVYCGKFAGQGLPDGLSVKDLTLRISMGVSDASVLPLPVTSDDLNAGKTLDMGKNSIGTFDLPSIDKLQAVQSLQVAPTPTSQEDSPSPTPKVQAKVTIPTKEESTPTPEPVATPVPEVQPTPAPKVTIPPKEELPSTPETTPEVAATPTPEPVATPVPQPSALNFLIPTAYADTLSGTSPNDILQVRYTTDGASWIVLGNISKTNYKTISFTIPLNSMDEIGKIQVAVSSLPTLDTQSVYYIDSMWLEAAYDSNLTSFAKNVGQNVIDALTLKDLVQPEVTPVPNTLVSTASSSVASRPKIQKKIYALKLDQNNQFVSESGSGLAVSSPCKDTYFVTVIYRNRDDFINDPTSSVYNKADSCQGGVYSGTISELPDVQTGDYYLVLGTEGKKGAWVPSSDPIKFHVIVSTIETEQQ